MCEAAAATRPGGAHRPCVCKGMVAARQRFNDDEVPSFAAPRLDADDTAANREHLAEKRLLTVQNVLFLPQEIECAYFALICCDLLANGSPESKARL